MTEAVIVSAVRTATGKFQGSLKGFAAPQLGALVVAEAVRRAGIDPAAVDECIMSGADHRRRRCRTNQAAAATGPMEPQHDQRQ